MAKKKIVQQPPFTVLIEPTEGCNLGCSFCGLRGMRVGFLPDSSGQESLPEITPEIKKLAQSVHKDGFLSPIIIKRKWEK